MYVHESFPTVTSLVSQGSVHSSTTEYVGSISSLHLQRKVIKPLADMKKRQMRNMTEIK